ncbi:MAG: hypothetical protein RIQ33_1234 [Bacteroidota bacterium]|jgi:fibronectin type 3 domain-containing protein
MKKIFIVLLFALITFWANAQSNGAAKVSKPSIQNKKAVAKTETMNMDGKPHLLLVKKNYKDSTVFRWVVTENTAWSESNKKGYILEKAEITDLSSAKNAVFKAVADTFKPMQESVWQKVIDTSNHYEVIAAASVYQKQMAKTEGDKQNIINKYNEQANRMGFALFAADNDSKTATRLGLRYVEKNLPKGKAYIYRLRSLYKDKVHSLDSAYTLLITDVIDTLPAPPPLATQSAEHAVKLEWPVIAFHSQFTAFIIQRSDDNGKKWFNITHDPISVTADSMSGLAQRGAYVDEVKENYEKHLYRIIGITPFAEKSAPSPSVLGFGRDKTPPIPPQLTLIYVDKNKKVQLAWKKDKNENDLKGFYIGYSTVATGPFHKVGEMLTPDKTTFTTEVKDFFGTSYYVVMAEDTAGNNSLSYPRYLYIRDSTPPIAPTIVSGRMDTTGRIVLKWKMNKEPDLKGYRVYMADHPTDEYSLITNDVVYDTVFVDSLNAHTLNKIVYYKIVALDNNFNHSPFSAIIKVARPDLVAPVVPVFDDIKVTDKTVILHWVPSTNTDVKEQLLYRKNDKGKMDVYAHLKPTDNSFTDDKVVAKKFYTYQLQAIDKAGNKSELSKPIAGRPFDASVNENVKNFTTKYDSIKRVTNLSWNANVKGKNYYVVILRKYNNNHLVAYKYVDATLNQFNDVELVGKGNYEYAVRLDYPNGETSKVSETQKIVVR